MYTNHVAQSHHPLPVHNGYSNHMPNGHHHHPPLPNGPSHPPQAHRPPAPPAPREVVVHGIPSVTVENDRLVVGDSRSTSVRRYTPLKIVGDGSFGTVTLCDWHGPLPPNTPLPAMQRSAGARQEYAGKRLVAIKRMKKPWEGGWDECKKLKELESLRRIPYHPNIIPLYDFFLLPETKELYFVFESMEGNLYQLIKTRKGGRNFAGGLVSSIFRQVVSGLDHIHACGYFHRDLKPENLLVTTTGLYHYRSLSPQATDDTPPESDVVVIVKLADFGLARETKSRPPYTEYVSTRWYRAPEVLLKSKDYSNPVDMWALGTIMAEVVNLRPLFPGNNELDQIAKICELLGDPSDYGKDDRGKSYGGGPWQKGVKMARSQGFSFPKTQPWNFYDLFDPSVPIKLVQCIADLLKYDPNERLTSRQCLEHPYLLETTPLNNPIPSAAPPPTPPDVRYAQHKPSQRNGAVPTSLHSVPPRHLPLSHTHTSVNLKPEFQPSAPAAHAHIPDASSSHRSSFYDTASSARARVLSETSSRSDVLNSIHTTDLPQVADSPSSAYGSSVYSVGGGDRVAHSLYASSSTQGEWDAMDISPQAEVHPDHYVVTSHPMAEIQTSPVAREYPARPVDPEPNPQAHPREAPHTHTTKFKLAPFGFTKKRSKLLGSMFGHSEKSAALPPVQEVASGSAGSTPSLKRTQSSSTDSRSLSELSPLQEVPVPPPHAPMDAKTLKKEAERMAREAEQQRRERARQNQRQQARAVMEKQKRLLRQTEMQSQDHWQWMNTHRGMLGAPPSSFPSKGKQAAATGSIRQTQSHGSKTVDAAGGSYNGGEAGSSREDWRKDSERVAKARRREFDDDHSMSSSDLHSGMSVISFATVDSDPGPGRSRHRSSFCSGTSMGRMTSMSSLRTTVDDYSLRGRSPNSLSLEQHLDGFHLRPSVDTHSSLSDGGSPPPPPLHMLSLSSPTWQQMHPPNTNLSGSIVSQHQSPPSLTLPIPGRHAHHLGGQPFGHPPSPGAAPKSAINPMFKVDSPNSLPPCSTLEAVADGEYPPLSPMSFTSPDDMDNDES